jgi:hypothetical protein
MNFGKDWDGYQEKTAVEGQAKKSAAHPLGVAQSPKLQAAEQRVVIPVARGTARKELEAAARTPDHHTWDRPEMPHGCDMPRQ